MADHIACGRCNGAYWLQPKIYADNGKELEIRESDTDDAFNPMTLICAHCGVCIQRINGEWLWQKKDDKI